MTTTETKLPSRDEYMQGKVTHDEFYNSVARVAGIRFSEGSDIVKRCKSALSNGDEHFNTIGLREWDRIGEVYHGEISRALELHGDFFNLAGVVCTLKAAVRSAIRSNS